ncbi:hypothetical protein EYZ11_011225 [Aspergillus tanneri]|uniref:Uncharacterized protein n=1 Tax=Aspergillus tanneri TaxID=1220188 RepID=A0A4S3J8T0_9EURO|nr:hypothetical protein EYZ11_011225 [Aspergillus tanneri]
MQNQEQESSPLSDGEILHQLQVVPASQQGKYQKLFSTSKRRLIKRLENKFQYESVKKVLLQLLEYPGLRSKFRAGVFSNWFVMKCPEEITHYLTHILSVWSYIMGPGGTQDLDPKSVELLQGRSPVCCAADYCYISNQIEAGVLFSHVEDPEKRIAIAYRALSIPTIIPSLFTVMEDTKYLMPCAQAIRKLIRDAAEDTIRACLWSHYHPQCPAIRAHSTFLQAYRTLWLFTMQHFPDLGEGKPLLDGRGCERKFHISPEITNQRRSALAQLALSLGFDTPQIQDILRALPSLSILPPLASSNKPRLTQRGFGRWKLGACSGMPCESSFMQSRPFMTLHNIDKPLRGGEGQTLTPFAVARNVFQAFLGHLPSLPEDSAEFHETPSAREASTSNVEISSLSEYLLAED